MTDNHRRFSRSRLAVQVEVVRPDGSKIVGQLRDVSMNGMFVISDVKPAVNEECQLAVVLLGATPPVRIEAEGHILRHEGKGFAVQFDGIDIESFQHMTRLVMYNADEPDQVEAEFAEHSGIYPRAW